MPTVDWILSARCRKAGAQFVGSLVVKWKIAFECLLCEQHSFWFHLPRRLPYNWHNPIAYVLTYAIETGGFIYITLIMNSCYSIFYGCCVFIVALVDDLKLQLDIFDQRDIHRPQNRIKFKLSFKQLIQSHLQAVELSDFGKMFSHFQKFFRKATEFSHLSTFLAHPRLAGNCSKVLRMITCTILTNMFIHYCAHLLYIHVVCNLDRFGTLFKPRSLATFNIFIRRSPITFLHYSFIRPGYQNQWLCSIRKSSVCFVFPHAVFLFLLQCRRECCRSVWEYSWCDLCEKLAFMPDECAKLCQVYDDDGTEACRNGRDAVAELHSWYFQAGEHTRAESLNWGKLICW